MPSYRLQYAGNDILRPSASLMDVMDRWLERYAPALYSHPGWDTHGIDHLPLPPKPKPRPPRLNVLEWPVGMSRWASFHCLVGSEAFAAIKEAVDPLAPTPADFSIEELDDAGVGTDVIRVPLSVVDVRPVFCSEAAAELEQEVFLLTLADSRYWAWWKPLEYDFAACNTWTDLLTNLVTAATGQTLAISEPIDALYGEPWPLRWFRPGVPLPLLIDAAAAQVGRRVVSLPNTSDTITLRDVDSALAFDATRWADYGDRCVAGGYDLSVANIPGSIPAGWAVGFPGDNQVIESGTLADLTITEYGDITGVAGESVWLRADIKADDADPALAELMATEWYKWQLSKTDATFRGIIEVFSNKNPSGMEDRVEWRYLPPDTDRRTVYQAGSAPTDIDAPGLDIVRDQVLTTVVPVDRADRNLYGDRPPPGYTYPVRVTAVDGDAMTAIIRVVDPDCAGGSGGGAEAVVDGPELGYGVADSYVLYRDPLADAAGVGDVGTAVPDPVVPNRWVFVPAGASAADATGCYEDFPRRSTDCLLVTVSDRMGLCAVDENGDPLPDQEFVAEWVGGAYPGGYWEGLEDVITPIGSGVLTITPAAACTGAAEIVKIVVDTGGGSGSGELLSFCGGDAGCTDGGGRRWTFGDETLCPGVPGEACGQHRFTVSAGCTECPAPPPYDPGICDCEECPDGASSSFTFALSGGTGDFDGLNGEWSVTNTGGCVWAGELGDAAATLTVGPGGAGTLTVTDGAGSVTFDIASACCGGAAEVTDSTGTGTPTGDTALTGVGNCGPCQPVTTECCEEEVPPVLYVTFGGSLSAIGTVAIVYNPAALPNPQWESEPFDSCHNTETVVQWSCSELPPDTMFVLSWLFTGEFYPPGVGGFEGSEVATDCSPFFASGSGDNISNACLGGPGSEPYTFTVTETPP